MSTSLSPQALSINTYTPFRSSLWYTREGPETHMWKSHQGLFERKNLWYASRRSKMHAQLEVLLMVESLISWLLWNKGSFTHSHLEIHYFTILVFTVYISLLNMENKASELGFSIIFILQQLRNVK